MEGRREAGEGERERERKEREWEDRKLALVNVSNSFRDRGRKRLWRNRELVAGRNGAKRGFL